MQDGHVGQLKLETGVGRWWTEFRLVALTEPKKADGNKSKVLGDYARIE